MSATELDVWFKDQARDQLRTFSKSIKASVSVNVTGLQKQKQSDHHAASTDFFKSHSTTVYGTKNVTLASSPSSVFAGDLAGGLATGGVATSQDVAQSIANAVRSAVDTIEGELGDIPVSVSLCHNSCHNNCHSNRGRR